MSKPISPEKAFQSAIKAALANADCRIDQIICRKNGNIEVKRSYFYRMGTTAASYADSIRETLHCAGSPARVSGEDRWAEWPKTSYFVATITPVTEPKTGN
jgi:hypothetical protein